MEYRNILRCDRCCCLVSNMRGGAEMLNTAERIKKLEELIFTLDMVDSNLGMSGYHWENIQMIKRKIEAEKKVLERETDY